MAKIALDTNILIYNHGLDGNHKRLISERFFKESPVISPQVISEYINVMQRFFKIEKNELIEMCAQWLKRCTIQPIVFSTIA
jgi:predicted nucleic acid-binding protein